MNLPDFPSLLLLMLRVNKVKHSETVSCLKLVYGDGVNVLYLKIGESC